MTATTRLFRLGQARYLTRSVLDGDMIELNSHLRWDMPLS